jgi:hypothetical protein
MFIAQRPDISLIDLRMPLHRSGDVDS